MSRFTLALGVALLVVEASVAVAIIATSSQEESPWVTIGLAVTAGVAFVVSGLIALSRRPENRTGIYLAATGYVWFLGALADSDNEWVFTVGFLVGNLVWTPFTALVLAYPAGRLQTRFERALPIAVAVLLTVPAFLRLLFDPNPASDRCDGCPGSAIVVAERPGLGAFFDLLVTIFGLGLIGLIVAILVRRWRSASPALRRLLRPVIGAGVATLVSIGLVVIADLVSSTAADALQLLFFASFSAVPIAFLFGILQSRLARSSAADLVVALEHGTPLRDALAEALGDPSLEISYRPAGMDRWVDAEGHSVPEPAPSEGRAQTTVEHAGLPIAVLDYDAQLAEERELIDAAAAAASLRIQNERLYAGVRAQYAFLETMTDTAPSLLVNVDTEGRILNQNRAAVAAAGVGDQDLVRGHYFWDVFISPSERDDVIARFRALAPDFPPAEYENTFVNQLGEERVIYWRSAPVQDDAGHTVSIIAGGLDITERVRISAEKEREREFLNAIANNAPSLLCLIDEQGRVTDRATNLAFERTLEVTTNDGGGHVFWVRYVDPSEASEVEERIRRVIGGETVGEHDNHWVSRSGRRLLIAWTCTPLPRIDQRTLFLLSGVDVTERKERELELQRERDFLSATANSIPTLLVLVDADGVVTDRGVNAAFSRSLGYQEHEVIGRALWDVVTPETERAELESAFRRCIASDTPLGTESRWRTRDGAIRLVEWATIERPGAEGGRQYLISANDVTMRRQQEEEIRASRARIVHAADEARRGLERNLHDGAQQRLVALSIALRLVESRLREDPGAAATILEGAREELAQALEELRELARGIHPAVLTDRGLAPAVQALVARVPIPVEVDVPAGRLPPAVEAASYYVVAEALTNVAKYADASTARVQVTQDDGRVVVEVADDGAGGADPGRGSGLRGLADRVAALDGSLVVESPTGQGTRVRAEIPVVEPSSRQ